MKIVAKKLIFEIFFTFVCMRNYLVIYLLLPPPRHILYKKLNRIFKIYNSKSFKICSFSTPKICCSIVFKIFYQCNNKQKPYFLEIAFTKKLYIVEFFQSIQFKNKIFNIIELSINRGEPNICDFI